MHTIAKIGVNAERTDTAAGESLSPLLVVHGVIGTGKMVRESLSPSRINLVRFFNSVCCVFVVVGKLE